ncbi:hypothetical protein V1478_004505 [Vespula squamosa]|uniref:Uncharacterized protein n=1 Tax=Vespula squamosa TaxID=30214 RepID=A0ABD2BGC5_VESSQ
MSENTRIKEGGSRG